MKNLFYLFVSAVLMSSCSMVSNLSQLEIDKRLHRPGFHIHNPMAQSPSNAMMADRVATAQEPVESFAGDAKNSFPALPEAVASERAISATQMENPVVPIEVNEETSERVFNASKLLDSKRNGQELAKPFERKMNRLERQLKKSNAILFEPGANAGKPTHWASIVAMVFGALGILYPPLGVIGLLFGIFAIFHIAIKAEHSGMGLAIAGISCFFLGVILWAILLGSAGLL